MTRFTLMILHGSALLLIAHPAVGQVSSDSAAKTRILQLEEQRRLASLRGDTAELGRIQSGDFFEVGAGGQIRTRRENFTQRATGDLRIDSLAFDSVEVHVFGSVAVAVGIARRSGISQGKRFDQPPMRYSKVYVRDNGDWHIVFGQNTPITEPRGRE